MDEEGGAVGSVSDGNDHRKRSSTTANADLQLENCLLVPHVRQTPASSTSGSMFSWRKRKEDIVKEECKVFDDDSYAESGKSGRPTASEQKSEDHAESIATITVLEERTKIVTGLHSNQSISEQERYRQAEYHFTEALARQDPRYGNSRKYLSRRYPSEAEKRSFFSRGRRLCANKKYEEAEAFFARAMIGYTHGNLRITRLSVKHWLNCPLYKRTNLPGFRIGARHSITDYTQSSAQCNYCRLLMSSIRQLYSSWADEYQDLKFVEICDVSNTLDTQPYVQLRLAGEGLSGAMLDRIEIRIDADPESAWRVDPRGSLSPLEWERMEYCLKHCVGSHPSCRTPDPHFIPKRLLRIVEGDSNVQLVESQQIIQANVRYCALSYCWGVQDDPFMTLKENLEQHLNGISLSTLPQTIHDAVIVSRSLKIPYLYVDALCIVQNDDGGRDWAEQSGEMCEIYSNAHLVISVDASPSNDFGFLPGRDHREQPWTSVDVSGGRHQLVASVRALKPNTIARYDGKAWDGKSVSPLLQRGWALQEGILANRLIRFTIDGIKWECNHEHVDQRSMMSRAIRLAKLTRMYPELKSKVSQSKIGALYPEEATNSRHITDFMTMNTKNAVYYAWQEIVSEYSTKQLTKIDDKLSALSGLARLISEGISAKPDEYLAGHWKGDLVSSLLWYVSRSNFSDAEPPPTTRALPYRAPTWSWASSNGPVEYFHEQYQFHFRESLALHTAECHPSSLDLFGRVSFGKLTVTGLVVPVSLQVSCTPEYRIQYTGYNGSAGNPYTNQLSWVSLPALDRQYEVLLDYKLPAEVEEIRFTKCMLIGRHLDNQTGGSRAWWLVLKQASTEGQWERIGIGYFQEYSEELTLFDGPWARSETITLV